MIARPQVAEHRIAVPHVQLGERLAVVGGTDGEQLVIDHAGGQRVGSACVCQVHFLLLRSLQE